MFRLIQKITPLALMLLLGVCQAVVAGGQGSGVSQQGEVTLAIVGGRLIDGYGGLPLEDSVILVSKDTITAVGRVGETKVPEGVQVIDANGMTVMPGLWESHGHLFHVGEGEPVGFQKKFKDQALQVMSRVAEISLSAGITTFRDLGGPLEVQKQLRSQIRAHEKAGPRLFLAGSILFQGPSSQSNDEELYVSNAAVARETVRRLIERKVDQIKVYAFWDLPVLQAVTQTAHEAGLGVDADVRHIVAYRTAIRAGVDRLHHVFTADPLSDYSPEDLRLLIRGERPVGSGPPANILRGPYILPTMEMRMAYVRALRFPEIVDHPQFLKEYGPQISSYLRRTWANVAAVPWGIGAPERMKVVMEKVHHFIESGGREQLVAGCDAGSPFNFHSPLTREMANLVDAGLTPMEAIQSATLRPAQMQGVEKKLGTVSVGKLADILIVDGDPLSDIRVLQYRIAHVIKGGEIYR